MAKNNKVKENVTVENVQEEVQQATADAPVEETKVSFSEKHPKLAAFGGKAKKVGKWIVIGAGAVGTAVLINKAGEAKGFNKAIDAMNNASNGTNPEAIPEEIPQVEEEIPVVDDVTTTEF